MLQAFRLSDYDTPLPPSPSSRSGRYHVVGGRPAHYWSLHPQGPWAEMLRANGMRTQADTLGIRKRLWVARFDLDPLVLGFAEADAYGIAPHDLVADDHAACQALAARLVDDGVMSMVVPSAALPGADNLVLFRDLVQADYGPTPVDPRVDVPTAVAADQARPQAEVVELVCHIGDDHPALEAWAAGRPYAYAQPPAPVRGGA